MLRIFFKCQNTQFCKHYNNSIYRIHMYSGQAFDDFSLAQFHTPSVQHNPQFHTKNPSVPHTPQFNTPFSSEGFWVWNLGGFGVELRNFGC